MAKTDFKSIDEYISTFPEDIADKLNQVRKIMGDELPDAVETISYQIPCFKQNGKYVIYFAGYKNHLGVYPIPPGDKDFQKEIEPYVKGKGTLQFSNDKELPVELIKKVTKKALKANIERTKSY